MYMHTCICLEYVTRPIPNIAILGMGRRDQARTSVLSTPICKPPAAGGTPPTAGPNLWPPFWLVIAEAEIKFGGLWVYN
jgi:hypothetical protein